MARLNDLPLDHKDVVVRVDFNVPLSQDGTVIDNTRLKASIPTINYLINKKCRVVLISHLGRPSGYDASMSMKKLVPHLEELLNCPVSFIDNLDNAKSSLAQRPYPSVTLLENLRFFKAEEDPSIDPMFAKKLSELGEYYINDAFACAHRSHSSITEIAKFFENRCACGLLMTHEVTELSKVLKPKHPFYLILGGSKISTKIGIINSLLPKCDALFIGGAMAFPFLKASGISTGSLILPHEQVEVAQKVLIDAKQNHIKIFLPGDWQCKKDINSKDPIKICSIQDGIEPGYQPFDIGPHTINSWTQALTDAHTIFWNGPLGVYEVPPFDNGTTMIARAISKINCESIVGGGDSVAAIEKQNLTSGFSHLSTGGGASLEFLEKGSLPGIQAIGNN